MEEYQGLMKMEDWLRGGAEINCVYQGLAGASHVTHALSTELSRQRRRQATGVKVESREIVLQNRQCLIEMSHL